MRWLLIFVFLVFGCYNGDYSAQYRVVETQLDTTQLLDCVGWHMDVVFLDSVKHDSSCDVINDIGVYNGSQTKYFSKDSFLLKLGF